MKIKEGDAFNASKLRQSKTNIEDLGYFDKVNVSTNPSLSQPGKMDIAIDVNENQRAHLTWVSGIHLMTGCCLISGFKSAIFWEPATLSGLTRWCRKKNNNTWWD